MGIEYYNHFLNIFKGDRNDMNDIILVYDKDLIIGQGTSYFNMIPILKYLEVFDLYIENLVFTCSHELIKKCKQIYQFDNRNLVNKYNYKIYPKIVENPPPVLIAILSQIDENLKKKSINNIIDLYRKKDNENNHKLILIVDKENFMIFDEVKILKESLFFPPISFEDIYNAARKAFEYLKLKFTLQESGKNIGLEQIALFLGSVENKTYNNVRDLFLNLHTQPYSPLWDYFSVEITNFNKEDPKNNEIKMKNIFKFININNKITKEEKKRFIINIQEALKKSIFDKGVRESFIKKLIEKEESINQQSYQDYCDLIDSLNEKNEYFHLIKNFMKFRCMIGERFK